MIFLLQTVVVFVSVTTEDKEIVSVSCITLGNDGVTAVLRITGLEKGNI